MKNTADAEMVANVHAIIIYSINRFAVTENAETRPAFAKMDSSGIPMVDASKVINASLVQRMKWPFRALFRPSVNVIAITRKWNIRVANRLARQAARVKKASSVPIEEFASKNEIVFHRDLIIDRENEA
jgi:hypothetical protein